MAYEAEFDDMLNQVFTVQARPADSDNPDEWVDEAGGWEDNGTVYGHLNPGRVEAAETTGDGPTRDTAAITWNGYFRPTGLNSATPPVTVATASIMDRKGRLVGPTPDTRIFSIQNMVARYDQDGVHHFQLVLSEVS